MTIKHTATGPETYELTWGSMKVGTVRKGVRRLGDKKWTIFVFEPSEEAKKLGAKPATETTMKAIKEVALDLGA